MVYAIAFLLRERFARCPKGIGHFFWQVRPMNVADRGTPLPFVIGAFNG